VYSACKVEDCVEDGGLAVCTEPEIRPPSNWTDENTDAEKFGYDMCDEAGPSIPAIAAWCAAEGGTWVVTGADTQACNNLPAQYPGVGSASNEQAAVAASDQYAQSQSCATSLANDSGWGLVDPTDQLCWSGHGAISENGKIVWDTRLRQYSYGPPLRQRVVWYQIAPNSSAPVPRRCGITNQAQR
jgi:hypothetical protein